MKDEELAEAISPPAAKATTYELLVRQSRKLGGVATSAFHELKHVLNHEINMPSRDQLLSGLSLVPRLKNSKHSDEIIKIKKLVRHSHEVLAHVHTVFPMTLFPDSIVVDRTKVTIVKRSFFWSSSVMSLRIEDILNVSSDVGPLFGSLTIASRVMSSVDHFQIHYFWRADAIFLKHIIQGYVFARQNNVNVGKLPRAQLIETLAELGHD